MSKIESENTFDPEKFIKGDPGLKTSNLFKYYQSLDAQKETDNNIPAPNDDEQKKHLDELKNHLKNIFSNLDKICKSTDSRKIKCCEYLIYWLYGKIAEKKLNFFGIRELLNNLEEIIKEKSSIINEDDCTRNLIKYAPIEVLHNKKILYDFLEYYIYLNDESSKIEANAKGKYCKYITHIFELYHKLYEEDRQWGLLQRYENELKLFRTTFTNESMLTSLKSKCNIDNLLIESFKDVKTTHTLEENHFRRRATSNRYDNNFTNIKNEYEKVLKDLPSFQIYKELGKDVEKNKYESIHCNKLSISDNNDSIKKFCKKLLRNLTELPELDQMKKKSQIDRCLYLNFWIHDELSKIYKNTEEKIFDVPEVAKFLDVDIEINKDLIKKDLNTNKNKLMEQINNGTLPQDPDMIVKNYDFSKYNPCFFNYNCRFSECREMKHLYEYFKDYKTIKEKINCDQGKNDKYFKYLTYISSLYNKHKDEEGCCPWGANMCPNYFLQCDEAYDPRKLVEALESGNPTKCTEIKESAGVIKTLEAETEEEKLRNSMYIKYMTCSYIPGSHFNKKGLICQQQSQRPHINNKFLSRYTSYNPPINISTPVSKNITVNGKPMNVALISNPNASITVKDVKESDIVHLSKSKSGYYSALFPEVTEKVRAYYLEEAETACPKGQSVGEMSEYCKKSKQYNKIINLSNSQSANVTLEKDIENWEDIVIPDDTSFLNDILQRLAVRMGAVSLASLGAITMLFMYYKV
ncbi:hypothetical protein PVMG_05508 [Plasmodium vivax Mauritania I]|uniref:VIR protein n=1 Tax=Plasmodium vivax Mauritania I TaxID=1035515 RepID=A0A0J9TJH2_PLAVI|nr:hypothetical protein PVMG_05508 [Plasmodium vivax Mauritania I]